MKKPLMLKTLTATFALFCASELKAQLKLNGIVTDSAGAPVSGAAIRVEKAGQTATTGDDGRFSIGGTSAVLGAAPQAPLAGFRDGSILLSIAEKSAVTVTAYGLQGKVLATVERVFDIGSHSVKMPEVGSGVRFFRVKAGASEMVVKVFSVEGGVRSAIIRHQTPTAHAALAKQAQTAAMLDDTLTASKTGFFKSYVTLSSTDSSNIKITMLKTTSPKFSFFVTSMKALQELSGSDKGFGGDFRFGETGVGAGLRGADKLCAAIAERSMKGSGNKGWRAFLSVTADASGKQVNAVNRVGPGPWYDRVGRLLAPTKADLLNTRPQNGDPIIQNDIPNENGIPNHRPDPSKPEDDNHHMVTGSTTTGTLYSATATCLDWTSVAATSGKPRCGFAWPRGAGGGAGGTGSHWISGFDAGGCVAGIQVGTTNDGGNIIGSSGGYGGYYCFALNP